LPSVSAPDAVQYGSLLSSVFENLFRFKETQLDEQRVSNETKKTDSDIDVNKANIVNSTNSTNSAMRVDAAKVKELLSQKDLIIEKQDEIINKLTKSNEEIIKSNKTNVLSLKLQNEKYQEIIDKFSKTN
jgi:hypothetical protein